jgi:hypothetical protein
VLRSAAKCNFPAMSGTADRPRQYTLSRLISLTTCWKLRRCEVEPLAWYAVALSRALASRRGQKRIRVAVWRQASRVRPPTSPACLRFPGIQAGQREIDGESSKRLDIGQREAGLGKGGPLSRVQHGRLWPDAKATAPIFGRAEPRWKSML